MRVVYAERARRDIKSIATFLRARHPGGAARVGAAIRRSAERLTIYPYSGRLQDDPDHVRKLVVPGFGYLLYYRVEGETDVVVLTIRHPAQDRLYDDL